MQSEENHKEKRRSKSLGTASESSANNCKFDFNKELSKGIFFENIVSPRKACITYYIKAIIHNKNVITSNTVLKALREFNLANRPVVRLIQTLDSRDCPTSGCGLWQSTTSHAGTVESTKSYPLKFIYMTHHLLPN